MSISFKILNISVVSVFSNETIFNVVWKISVVSVVSDETILHLVLKNSIISVFFYLLYYNLFNSSRKVYISNSRQIFVRGIDPPMTLPEHKIG